MADLDAQEVEQLQTKEYWDSRYQNRDDEDGFDWFKTYNQLKTYIAKYIPDKTSRILMLGCGNSTLSGDMYDDGYKKIVNVDFSQTCIDQMSKARPEMTWIVQDIRDMDKIEDGSIDVALDKGTLDALVSYKGSVWSIPEDVKSNTDKYMSQVHRVLKPKTGLFLYISYRQPHFARPIIDKKDYWNLNTDILNQGEGSFDYYLYAMTENKP